MKNEIFVNVGPRETRVAVRETDRVVELHIERTSERGVAGGIYKGKVTRVLPGMQAAFVDIGLERAGFLYVTDYRADFDDVDDGDEPAPAASRRRGAAQRGQGPQIEDLLEEGREILVHWSLPICAVRGFTDRDNAPRTRTRPRSPLQSSGARRGRHRARPEATPPSPGRSHGHPDLPEKPSW